MSAEARHALATTYQTAGDYRAAVEALEPLRASGDHEATEKLKDLFPLAAQQARRPRRGHGLRTRRQPPGMRGEPRVLFPAPEERDSAACAARMPADRLQGMLDAAQMLVGKGKKQEAFAKWAGRGARHRRRRTPRRWRGSRTTSERSATTASSATCLLASVRQMGSNSDASISAAK